MTRPLIRPGAAEEQGAFLPGYLGLLKSGELSRRCRLLEELLVTCTLCPRDCRADRNAGEVGFCGVGRGLVVAAVNLHQWEEPPISGTGGSGTIFFTGCSLACVFCQNYPISQMGIGRQMSVEELAGSMMDLQRRGAHNINLVTPTHQMPAFTRSLLLAAEAGLKIPIVYNSSGFEKISTLRLLEDIVDIYLPDMKYSNPETARMCSGRADYVQRNRAALAEMWRQVGPLVCGPDGIARRGMLIRHLVLPGGLSGTLESLRFVARTMSTTVPISLMNQYFPAFNAIRFPPLDRKTSRAEYDEAFNTATALGFEDGFIQSGCDEELLFHAD